MHLTGEQIVAIFNALPQILAAVGVLYAALTARKAGKRAEEASASAAEAHVKASEAVREQINFALKRAAQGGGN